MMETLITTVHVIAAFFMILVVLVQGGQQGGIGAAFGGGNSQGVFGASGATSLLGKLTYVAAAIFMISSVYLTASQGTGGDIGLTEKLKAKTESTAPAETPKEVPATSTPAPTK